MSARTFNRVQLMGFVPQAPQYFTYPSSTLLIFKILTIDTYKSPETGEWAEKHNYHTIKAWNKLADTYSKLLQKGTKVLLEGELRTTIRRAKDEKTYYTINEVHLRDLIILRQPS